MLICKSVNLYKGSCQHNETNSNKFGVLQVLIEILYVSFQTMVYTLIVYSMIRFEWTVGKFFMFYYFMVMCYIYYTMFGMMLVALTPNLQVAAISMSFFMSFWNLFSGFLIPRTVSHFLQLTINY